MGELALFYAASDFAFVGGSFVPIGGHNMLEPAVLGIPIIVGPYVHNYLEITKKLTDAGALIQILDSDSLAKAALRWFANPVDRKQAEHAQKAVNKSRRC